MTLCTITPAILRERLSVVYGASPHQRWATTPTSTAASHPSRCPASSIFHHVKVAPPRCHRCLLHGMVLCVCVRLWYVVLYRLFQGVIQGSLRST